tara:strand:+ start:1866 stop:2060 length:195 start_codon:yes stop_codon:yes gene_type:complete
MTNKETLLLTIDYRLDDIFDWYKEVSKIDSSTIEGKKELKRVATEDFITMFGTTAERLWEEYND